MTKENGQSGQSAEALPFPYPWVNKEWDGIG